MNRRWHNIITYLTRPLMSLCMHDWQGRFHGHLRATYFSCPLPILANNVLPEELYSGGKHSLGLQKMGITVNLSLIHVHCPLCKSMTTTSYFKPCLIQLCSSSSCVLCCFPVWFPTHAIFHILKDDTFKQKIHLWIFNNTVIIVVNQEMNIN